MVTFTEIRNTVSLLLRQREQNTPQTPPPALARQLVELHQSWDSWNDPKSEQIKNWMSEVITLDETDTIVFDEAFNQRPVEYLGILINYILTDDVFKNQQFGPQRLRLIKPVLVLEKSWTCEELFFRASNVTNKGAPFTLVPHQPAQEIREWAANFIVPQDAGFSTQLQQPVTLEDIQGTEWGPAMLIAYRAKLCDTLFHQDLDERLRAVREATERLASMREEITRSTAEQVAEAEIRAARFRAQLEQAQQAAEEQHQREIRDLQQDMQQLRIALTEVESDVSAVRATAHKQQVQIQQLKDAYAQERARVDSLNAMVAQMRGKKKRFLGIKY